MEKETKLVNKVRDKNGKINFKKKRKKGAAV